MWHCENHPVWKQSIAALRSTLLIAGLTVVASCGGNAPGGPSPVVQPAPTPAPTPRPVSVERAIAPSTVNPALSAGDASYVVINPDPAVTPKERLFVMLPGTGGIPRNLRTLSRSAGPRGYHAIGLSYPNDTAIGDLCQGSSDANCTGNARREIITGSDFSPLVAVDTANSIAGRLTGLLAYLDRTYPTEGWGRFLVNGAVDWSLVTVAGHSQGSGHAAYMAKIFSLNRTVMFSGPSDIGQVAGTAAAWLSLPNVTPASQQYGFTHVADELVPYALVLNNWNLLGLGTSGAPVSVDDATSPYANSHQLNTNAAPNPNPGISLTYPRHLSTAIDNFIPLTPQSTPLYEPAWVYLAFP
jgi:hypothetical protein